MQVGVERGRCYGGREGKGFWEEAVHPSGAWAGRRGPGITEEPLGPWIPPGSGSIRVDTSPQWPCLCRWPFLGSLGPSPGATPAPLPLPSISLFPSSSGPCRGTGARVHRARRALPGPPRGDGAGQGPTGPPLALLSTEKYLPRAGGGLVGLARKGRGGGKATESPARVMYWMSSKWGASPSS